MAKASFIPESTAIWCDPIYAPLAIQVVELMGNAIEVVGVGGVASSEVDKTAQTFDCTAEDDPRQLMLGHDAKHLLLLTDDPPMDKELWLSVGEQSEIWTLEPIVGDLIEARDLGLDPESNVRKRIATERVHPLPLMLAGPGLVRAGDTQSELGAIGGVSFESIGPRAQGSWYARMFDAWATVLHWVEMPESIDASLAGQTEVQERLRKVSGTVALHGRTPGGPSIAIMISDSAGRSSRRLEILGHDGALSADEMSYILSDAQGKAIDQADLQGHSSIADLMAYQWQSWLDNPQASTASLPLPRHAAAIACCQATLLSMRTGQPELPGRQAQLAR